MTSGHIGLARSLQLHMVARRIAVVAIVLAAGPAVANERGRTNHTPILVLTPRSPDCTGAGGSERCRVLSTVAIEARLGTLAAIDGRETSVVTRARAAPILAERLLPRPCDSGLVPCAREAARGMEANWVVTATVTSTPGKPGRWSATFELNWAGTGDALARTGALDARDGPALRAAVETMVRSGLEPDPLGRRSAPAAAAAPSDVLVQFDSPQGGPVSVDGRVACMRTPCARRLPPGEHVARFEQQEHDAVARSFVAKEGALVEAELPVEAGRNRLAVVVPGFPGCTINTAGPSDRDIPECRQLRVLARDLYEGARSALEGQDADAAQAEWVAFTLHLRRVTPRCAADRDCALETARALGAEWVLSGWVAKGGAVPTLALREVRTGRVLSRSRAKGPVRSAAASIVRSGLALDGPSPRVAPRPEPPKRFRIAFESRPEGAALVRVDGRFVCITPCATVLPPGGPHQATFDKLRFAPAATTFDVTGEATVKGTLAPDFGWVGVHQLYDNVSADIGVADGRQGKQTQHNRGFGPEWGELEERPPRHGEGIWWREVDAGDVEIVAQHPCFLPVRQRVSIAAGEIRDVKLERTPRLAPLEVRAWDERGAPVTVPVRLDGRPVGSSGTPLEVPLCTYDSIRKYQAVPQVVSVPFDGDTFATWVALREGLLRTVDARPAPPGRQQVMVTVPGGSEPISAGPEAAALPTFLLDATEVTVRAYGRCVDEGACSRPHAVGIPPPPFLDFGGRGGGPGPNEACTWGSHGKADHPVNCVTWGQAAAYCAWAGKRLPTVAELEWAERAGSTGGGASARRVPEDERGCLPGAGPTSIKGERGFPQTCRVGAYPLGDSALGIQDLLGNVSEWTSTTAEEDRPRGALRAVFGAAWKARWGRGDARTSWPPEHQDDTIGFRCARTQAPSATSR